jgi:hypothetical protein
VEVFPFGELGHVFYGNGEPLPTERASRIHGVDVLELEDYLVSKRVFRIEYLKGGAVAEESLTRVEPIGGVTVDSGLQLTCGPVGAEDTRHRDLIGLLRGGLGR